MQKNKSLINNRSTSNEQEYHILAFCTYLTVLSDCSEACSLFSVLSGRPLVAILLDRESFGLFSGLCVLGPFTFLSQTIKDTSSHQTVKLSPTSLSLQ